MTDTDSDKHELGQAGDDHRTQVATTINVISPNLGGVVGARAYVGDEVCAHTTIANNNHTALRHRRISHRIRSDVANATVICMINYIIICNHH
jgi:hypothetical protein